ncbi:MAG: hypothetical protein CM15mP127_05640 [Gammaproteobacteria bacterium]|nr:MAG: hypothetical protein CM15mP127_05640 [Gammaproteobacteria bacterium]
MSELNALGGIQPVLKTLLDEDCAWNCLTGKWQNDCRKPRAMSVI